MVSQELTKDKLDSIKEESYILGQRAVYLRQLGEALRLLGYTDAYKREALIIEREETITALRNICETHGDNEWDNDLHLADIINKHLEPYLDDEVD